MKQFVPLLIGTSLALLVAGCAPSSEPINGGPDDDTFPSTSSPQATGSTLYDTGADLLP